LFSACNFDFPTLCKCIRRVCLKLSEQTVENHLYYIFDKFGISERVELVLYAVSNPNTVAHDSGDQKREPEDATTGAEKPVLDLC